ncbi:hypothetical protein JJJ17_17185 [Paracoccus caeni]|uniref:Uncharacterized protein n=1 Tax=Paracoccus caeni TaxID=657651 RepID=A0A934W1S4_9RHOB|nr:hypothetical protein [Paracoccus caeni]MBK4217668.1 hypothetical protein [Paracoccus caeni]
MSGRLVTLALVLAALPAGAQQSELAASIAACRLETETAARLQCYDKLPVRDRRMDIKGFGTYITPPFDLSAPMMLNFESMDAVLVVYLLDSEGEVVQNLHQAGVGINQYAIPRPGRYSVQINASGGWRIWLEEG